MEYIKILILLLENPHVGHLKEKDQALHTWLSLNDGKVGYHMKDSNMNKGPSFRSTVSEQNK